jgi:hypothetical protein
MNLLLLALLCGLTASGFTFTVRAVVQEVRPMWLLVKPLSCDLCMSWWASILAVLAFSEQIPTAPAFAVTVLAATSIGVLLTKTAGRLAD